MVEYDGEKNVHLKLLAKDEEVTEQIFNIVLNAGVVAMKEFLRDHSSSYYQGIVQQFYAWTFCSIELYDDVRCEVQRKRDDYADTWRINGWRTMELFCRERVADVLKVVLRYEKLLDKAPSVFRALIFDLKTSDDGKEIFAEACFVRINTIKQIFKRLGI